MDTVDFTEYRRFLEDFQSTVDPKDPLPVRVAGYSLTESEVTGEIIDWTLQYLNQQKCPPSLIAPIVREVIKETKKSCNKAPSACGFDGFVYQPLKLMHVVTSHTNDICSRLMDNAQLNEFLPKSNHPPLKSTPRYIVKAVKNTRRKMEDRNVIIEDFNGVFGSEDTEPTSFYGVFDGHGGQDAAAYCVSHLHYNIASSPKYPKNIEDAMRDAFLYTDLQFVDKSVKQNLHSGSTAVCALYRSIEKMLYVAYVGDSQALLVRQGKICQLVNSHSPARESEQKRIEKLGGACVLWGGSWRVCGTLAVSRAIGDAQLKPFVSGEPDITKLALDGEEDFLVMASDGLWESSTEDFIALQIYRQIREDPDNLHLITDKLIESAKKKSSDNITVIVIFFKDPHLIAKASWLDKMEAAYDNSTTNGSFGNATQDIFQKANILHDLDEDMNLKIKSTADLIETPSPIVETNSNNWCDQNIYDNNQPFIDTTSIKAQNEMDFMFSNDQTPNTNEPADMKTDESDMSEVSNRIFVDDFGPETDVDGMDDAMKSPAESDNNEMDLCDFAASEKEPSATFNSNPFSLENKIIEELSMQNGDFLKDNNPFGSENMDTFNEHFENHAPEETPIIDNKLIDELESYGTNGVAEKIIEDLHPDNEHRDSEDEDQHPVACSKKQEILDFSEKRDFSFEKNEFEKELTMDTTVEEVQECLKQELIDVDYGSLSQPEKIDEASATVEHVEESAGEESEEEDEWNYIKVEESAPKEIPTSDLKNAEDTVEQEEEDKIKESEIDIKESEIEEKEIAEIQGEEHIEEPSTHQQQPEEIKLEQETCVDEEIITEEEQSLEIKNEDVKIEPEIEDLKGESVDDIEIEYKPENISNFESSLQFEPEIEEKKEDLLEEVKEKLSEHIEEEISEAQEKLNLEMASQLNPEAKEFVPVSPLRSVPTSPVNNMPPVLQNPSLSLQDDRVISQSPKKGGLPMDDIDMPTEDDFDVEISHRPHELEQLEQANGNAGDLAIRSRSSSSGPSYQEMNLKEAMQADEKLEFEYNDEKQVIEDSSPDATSNNQNLLEQLNKGEDPMSMSFYEGRDERILNDDTEELNKVQELPDDITDFEQETSYQNGGTEHEVISRSEFDEISKPEEDMYSPVSDAKVDDFNMVTESDKPESELSLQETVQAPIIKAVSQVASEVTSLMNEIQSEDHSNIILECNLAPAMQFIPDLAHVAPEEDEPQLEDHSNIILECNLAPAMQFIPDLAHVAPEEDQPQLEDHSNIILECNLAPAMQFISDLAHVAPEEDQPQLEDHSNIILECNLAPAMQFIPDFAHVAPGEDQPQLEDHSNIILECNLAPAMQFIPDLAHVASEESSFPDHHKHENLISTEITEESAESDKCLQNVIENITLSPSPAPVEIPEHDAEINNVPPPTPTVVSAEEISIPVVVPAEILMDTTAAVTEKVVEEEPIKAIGEKMVEAVPEPSVDRKEEIVEEKEIEKEQEEVIKENEVEEVVSKATALIAATTAAAAAAVASATAVAATKKPADVKKPAAKTAAKPSTRPTKTSTTTTTKKPLSKPPATTKPISKPAVSSTTTTSKPKTATSTTTGSKLADKKPATTTATRKPPTPAPAALNGEVKPPPIKRPSASAPVKSTPSPTAPAKPASATSTVIAATAAPRPASTLTKTTTAARTTAKPPITKTTTQTASKVSTTTSTATKTSTARAPISSAPAVAKRVSSTTTSAAAKPLTSRVSNGTSTTTASKTTAAPKTALTTTVRKTEIKTSPASKTLSKTSSTTVKSTTGVTKTLSVTSSTATAAKSTTNGTRKSATTPIKKTSSPATKTSATKSVEKTKIVVENKEKYTNGDVILEKTIETNKLLLDETNEQKLNNLNLENDNNQLISDSNPQMIVIDSAAD